MYMRVIKRSGRIEDMRFDNVTNRIKNLTSGLSDKCDSQKIAQQVLLKKLKLQATIMMDLKFVLE